MNEEIRRIQNFLTFLEKAWKYTSWIGVILLFIGVPVFYIPKEGYSVLGIGVGFIGIVLIIRSLIGSKQIPKKESFLSREFVTNEIQELKTKISLLSVVLALIIITSIICVFIQSFRFLIPSLITITLYIVAEFIMNGIIMFRLSILENELYKDENC